MRGSSNSLQACRPRIRESRCPWILPPLTFCFMKRPLYVSWRSRSRVEGDITKPGAGEGRALQAAALDLKVDSPDHSDVNKLYHLRTPLDDIMCGAAGRGLYWRITSERESECIVVYTNLELLTKFYGWRRLNVGGHKTCRGPEDYGEPWT